MCLGGVRGGTEARPAILPVAWRQAAVYTCLFERVGRLGNSEMGGLLEESGETEAKRKADAELLAKLRAAKRALEALA